MENPQIRSHTELEKGECLVHFSGGSDSTYVAAVMAERWSRVHLITYERFTFIGTRDYAEKNFQRLCRIYGSDKFVRTFIKIDDLHREVCYGGYLKSLKQHGFTVAALSFSKLAMYWASARYALEKRIACVADGSVPYMSLYPDQNPGVGERLRTFFKSFGIRYETPAGDRPGDIEELLYAKGISTAPKIRGTDQDLQVFYLEQVLLAFYLKFHITALGVNHYNTAIERLYDDKLSSITQKLKSEFGSAL